VLIVEASVGSGALITANDAIAQGREVFAVPGKISDAGAEGPNGLIKNGAFPVHSAKDILTHYEFIYGDDFDLSRLEKAKRKMPSANDALVKHGLFYATETVSEEEPVFEVKRSRRATAQTGVSAEASADTPSAPVSNAESKREEASESASAIVEGLDPVTRGIYESVPLDKAISPDALIGNGLTTSDIITALTLLEIYGLISSLPGGLYIRK
jgi:predicted Rossmann fold nucleotide-binding protein DprA/Smf involved in DNA uptake